MAVFIKPNSISRHIVDDEFEIKPMTIHEFLDLHGGQTFNFSDLQNEFAKHCKDYKDDLSRNVGSRALSFCSKILYQVGPESRRAEKKKDNRVWVFSFKYDDDGHDDVHIVYVCTYRTDNVQYKQENADKTMVVSIKQAALLAMVTFNKLTALNMVTEVLLTPLAGACFPRDSMGKIAKLLGVTKKAANVIVNSSAQSGGQHLKESNATVALVAAYMATKKLKDDEMSDQNDTDDIGKCNGEEMEDENANGVTEKSSKTDKELDD